jgi:hypothetical protein
MNEQIPSERSRVDASDVNDDSLVGVPHHPAAAAAGALVAGAATGAVVGTAAGPVGTAVGAIAGAVVGAMGGDAIANSVEQVRDANYWRANYLSRPYVNQGDRFEDFGPAFEFGIASRQQNGGRTFVLIEPELAARWDAARGTSRLSWERARPAVLDAWGDALG